MKQESIKSLNQENQGAIALGFWESVLNFPDNNAIFINEEYYTYKQLAEIVNGIYLALKESNVTYKDRIGLICRNDIETYSSLLAISLFGGAYVPLSLVNPVERNKSIIANAGLELILSSEEDDYTKALGCKTLITKNLRGGSMRKPGQVLNTGQAYIMFTSGSTGRPKGVPVSNANANHYLAVMLQSGLYDFIAEDKFLQPFALTFDASVQWIFVPLSIGACVYVPPENNSMAIVNMMMEKEITVGMMIPSTLHYLQPYFNEIKLSELRYCFFGGEALSSSLLEAWLPSVSNAITENLYGPTEATIWCTRYRLNKSFGTAENSNGIVPIGKPNPGLETVVIDDTNNKVEKGQQGELCVSGPQVIDGYLDDRNTDKFINIDEKRYYKTGDLAFVDNTGNLIFCGRVDNQIKIDGYRIEPEEIEQQIFACCGLRSIVCVKTLPIGHLQLTAYIEGLNNDANKLKENLRDKLPEYMIPKSITSIDKLPLNANGKLDRKATL